MQQHGDVPAQPPTDLDHDRSGEEVAIHLATLGDLATLTRVRLRFLAEHRRLDPDEFPEAFAATTSEFLSRHHRADSARSWLAMRDGDVVAAVTMLLLDLAPRPFESSNTDGYVVNMYVEPAYRRRGIGQRLLGECQRAARDLDLRKLLLVATDDGRPLYLRSGFDPADGWMEWKPRPESDRHLDA